MYIFIMWLACQLVTYNVSLCLILSQTVATLSRLMSHLNAVNWR